ncbi:MAG TPA: excinuclease ABC subunit UvrC, partial [bacterium]|nr:excinuclease ABC subunit UvrC [bacterium]
MGRVTKTREQPWVAEKLAAIPDAPGCYFFKDAKGRVLYVGKAKSLKKRVSSYFTKGDHTLKTLRMLAQARDVEYLVVDSEVEALVVESNCIKKYQPRYNVALKDDKSYPYLKITLNERFPKAEFTRTLKDDGAKYYGPLSAGSVRAMLYLIQNVFQIRDCDLDMERVHPRPCLQYQIKKCSGPCIRAVDEAAYRRQIEGAMHFLEGEAEGVLEALEAEMARAAEEMAYERAAIFRDQIGQVRKFLENQKVVSKRRLDQDFLAVQHVGPRGVGAVLLIRGGKLVGREQYPLKVPTGTTEDEILAAFVGQYYTRATTIPKEILVPRTLP